MLDRILGNKDKDKKDKPDLHKNGKKNDSKMGERLKDMVDKVSGTNGKADGNKGNKPPSDKRIPRPMPKPKPKPLDKPRLARPDDKKPSGFRSGGRKIPDDDDRRTLVGAAVFGIILIILVVAGYYFLVYQPYQDTLNNAKMQKINETNTLFTGALATDPEKTILLASIDSGVTPDQVLAIDVKGPATDSWRTYQNQQINVKKDPYNRVMIKYTDTTNNQKNVLMNTSSAQTIVNESDATVLSQMEIDTPDTVAVPIMISRLQAAGGLINVGDTVDVYLNTNSSSGGNQTSNQTSASNASPEISGATVLAILRATDSGAVNANLTEAAAMAKGSSSYGALVSQSSQTDVEQLLRAASSGTWNEAQISKLLNSYGWKLSDFERESNLGQLDAQYLVVLEVPRENALFLIQNMNSVMLTVPTSRAPDWMINELKSIYGTNK